MANNRKRKKKTDLQRSIQKERQRINRRLNYYYKQGYRFESLDLPTANSRKTLNTLQSITSKDLLKNATAISEVSGKVISGLEKQRENRSLSAKRAYERRKREREEPPKQEALIWFNIESLLDKYSNHGAEIIRKELEKQKALYGDSVVAQAFSQAPQEHLRTIQNIIYYADSKENLHRQIRYFFDVIRGTVPTFNENKELADELEDDDFEEDE